MRYIAKPSPYRKNFIWTGQVEDDYVLESTEIFITQEEHKQLQGGGMYATITSGVLQLNTNKRQQAETNYSARDSLQKGDWKVIRELERLYLSGTNLNTEREALRNSIVEE